MAFSRIIIIYNPNSTGPSQTMAEDLARRLQSTGLPIELQATERAGHAAKLAAAAARRYDRPLIVSSSGDGGYHEVINGIMTAAAQGHPAVAAVLPAGNANDHRRTTRRQPLVEGIRAGRTSRLDLLRVSWRPPGGPEVVRYAHSYLGLGLTPIVATELNRHALNALRELWVVVRAFARFRPVAIELGGRTIRLDSLIISNIGQMAKVLKFSRTGLPTDGRFEITIFPAGSRLRLIARLIRAAVIGLPPQAQATRYEFTTLAATPIQLDGEVTDLPAHTAVVVAVAPAALETVH